MNRSVMEELATLHNDGVLTDEEFAKAKQTFLDTSLDVGESTIFIIRQLHSLFASGVLSESEFNTKKRGVLDGPRSSSLSSNEDDRFAHLRLRDPYQEADERILKVSRALIEERLDELAIDGFWIQLERIEHGAYSSDGELFINVLSDSGSYVINATTSAMRSEGIYVSTTSGELVKRIIFAWIDDDKSIMNLASWSKHDPVSAAVEPAAASGAPAAWYADPLNRFELRYWDGRYWTEHVSLGGRQYTDPFVV